MKKIRFISMKNYTMSGMEVEYGTEKHFLLKKIVQIVFQLIVVKGSLLMMP
jgi:hypothetical protein